MPPFLTGSISRKLGAAFAILALGLVVVGWVGTSHVGTLADSATEMVTSNVTSLQHVSSVAQHVEGDAHDTAQHLYVLDGDLKAEDRVAAHIAAHKQADDADLRALGALLTRPELKTLHQRMLANHKAFVAARDEALARSRQETIDGDEERDGSRELYTGKVAPIAERTIAVLDQLRTRIDDELAADAKRDEATAVSAERSIWIIAVLALLTAAGLATVIVRSIVRGLRGVMQRLDSLNEHDLSSLQEGLGAMAQGDLTRDAEPVTEPVTAGGHDEIGQAGRTVNSLLEKAVASIRGYNDMRAQLASMIGQISATASSVSASSQQMASTSEEAGRAVGEIAAAVGEVAGGAERQVRMVEQARSASEQTGRAAGEAATIAEEGVRAAEQADTAMRELRESSSEVSSAIAGLAGKSERIGGIVQTITGIAGQTNLLALNAAIEAARAGEQGRGFAVVAEEVRKLAEESQTAAASIAALIDEIQTETDRTVQAVEAGAERTEESARTVAAAREAFEQIGQAVEDMRGRVAEIEQASAEVASVAEQSSASTEQVSASTQQTSASTQEIAASAQSLAASASELEQLVGRFTLSA
jgi:methyl-accepting chemotaxis protein